MAVAQNYDVMLQKFNVDKIITSGNYAQEWSTL